VTLDPFVHWSAKPARLTVESNATHDLAVGWVFLCGKRMSELPLAIERRFASSLA
jgi:hypothetical protein